MIKWALTFIVNRLILIGVFLLALNAFTQGSSCQYGKPEGLLQALADLPKAMKVLGNAFR